MMRQASTEKVAGKKTDWAALRPHVTEALLAEITHRIVEAFQPHQVVLFGSYAYGRPNLNSDVYLLVVMDTQEAMAQRIMRVAQVAQERFLPMDVLVYTPSEVEERLREGDFFIEEIVSKGKVLYQRGCCQ